MEGFGDKESSLWTPPKSPELTGASVQEVVDSFLLFLEVSRGDYHKAYKDRLESDPDAARAEALVFSWLRARRWEPQLADLPGVGGPDFLCVSQGERPFVIEVTSLNAEAVTARSGWPNELGDRVGSFSMITPNLWSKTKSKAAQLASKDCPRILVICLAHVASSALLGTFGARLLIASEPKLVVPLAEDGRDPDPVREVTDLKNAAFFRVQGDTVVPLRRSISSILLLAIFERQLEVVGLLHPDPAVPLDYRQFGDIPFLRVDWPVDGNSIVMEWVIGEPTVATFWHKVVALQRNDLTG